MLLRDEEYDWVSSPFNDRKQRQNLLSYTGLFDGDFLACVRPLSFVALQGLIGYRVSVLGTWDATAIDYAEHSFICWCDILYILMAFFAWKKKGRGQFLGC